MAKDLVKRGGIRAVEAFGEVPGRRSTDDNGHAFESPSCVLPADYLLGVGFRTHRPHARYPRMRMDLRSVLTWRERAGGGVRPPRWSPVRHRSPAVASADGAHARAPHAGLSLSDAPAGRAARSSLSRSTPVCGSASGAR